ncbi:MAG: hypothetical protein HQL63_06070 [Magnetococcales bacterium]|nr:hypothetical protein [Magnetococcales bacterium]MBF0321325.1 hypothetical protein [Magnetococcales bacterium]
MNRGKGVWQRPGYQLLIGWATAMLILLLTARTPQGLGFDPSVQVLAVEQYLQKSVPTPNHYREADQDDLSRDTVKWIKNWPPGMQLLFLPLKMMGLDSGLALRVLTALCFLVGSAGWSLWFGQFKIAGIMGLLLLMYVPTLRFVNNHLFTYSTEIIVYAISPWLLWGGWRLACSGTSIQKKVTGSAVLGFCCGLLYMAKYSGAFIIAGVLGFLWMNLVIPWLLNHARFRKFFENWIKSQQIGNGLTSNEAGIVAGGLSGHFKVAVVASGVFLIFFSIWGGVNVYHSGYVSQFDVMHQYGGHSVWAALFHVLTYPAQVVGDSEALWSYLLYHPVHGFFRGGFEHDRFDALINNLIGLPGGVLLAFLVSRPAAWRGPGQLGLWAMLAGMMGMVVVWTFAQVGFQGAYLQITCLAALPAIVQEALRIGSLPKTRKWLRFTLTIAGIFYLLIPACYGVVALIGKVERVPTGYQTGISGLYNPFFSSSTRFPADVAAELVQNFDPRTDVWYTPNVNMKLDLPGRALMTSDWWPLEVWQTFQFRTSRPVRLLALIPKVDETNGKARAIREAFVGAESWQHVPLSRVDFDLWISWIRPAGADRHRE